MVGNKLYDLTFVGQHMFMQNFIERQFSGIVLTDAWLASKTFGDGCMAEEGQF